MLRAVARRPGCGGEVKKNGGFWGKMQKALAGSGSGHPPVKVMGGRRPCEVDVEQLPPVQQLRRDHR